MPVLKALMSVSPLRTTSPALNIGEPRMASMEVTTPSSAATTS